MIVAISLSKAVFESRFVDEASLSVMFYHIDFD